MLTPGGPFRASWRFAGCAGRAGPGRRAGRVPV